MTDISSGSASYLRSLSFTEKTWAVIDGAIGTERGVAGKANKVIVMMAMVVSTSTRTLHK